MSDITITKKKNCNDGNLMKAKRRGTLHIYITESNKTLTVPYRCLKNLR